MNKDSQNGTNALVKFCKAVGLHPLVGFGLFGLDFMLFAIEGLTVGWAVLLTIPAGLLLSIPTILLQRELFKDSWGAALGKGMLLGLLTAIPTPLPAVVPFTGGVLGFAGSLMQKDDDSDSDNESDNINTQATDDTGSEHDDGWQEIRGEYSTA